MGTKLAYFGKFLAVLFAVLCVGASFGGGNAFQSNQATTQLISLFSIDGDSTRLVIGTVLSDLVGIVIIGGIKRIASISEKIVPFMAGIYVLASLIIIFANIGKIKYYEFNITGITSISVSSPSSCPSKGNRIPALFGALISRLISSEPMLFNISIINLELNPISISSP